MRVDGPTFHFDGPGAHPGGPLTLRVGEFVITVDVAANEPGSSIAAKVAAEINATPGIGYTATAEGTTVTMAKAEPPPAA